MPKSLIEEWFPAAIVGAESMRERGASSALPPINFLHVWWARRPLTTSRAAVMASLLPAWPTDEEMVSDPEATAVRKAMDEEFPGGESEYHAWFVKLIGISGNPVAARAAIAAAKSVGTTTVGNAYGYNRAFTVSPDSSAIKQVQRLASLRTKTIGNPPNVLDPFAGGGSIPFEAARFGCATVASELNPVAVGILHGTAELPRRLGPKFVSTIEKWGGLWADRVKDALAPFFAVQSPDERNAYIWAHTVPCPTSGYQTPLSPNYWLATGQSGRSIAVRLDADAKSGVIRASIVEGDLARTAGDASTYKGGTGRSLFDTRATLSSTDIMKHAQAGRMGQMLLGVSVTRAGHPGRTFRAPSDADLAVIDLAKAELERRRPGWEILDLIPSEVRFIGPADRSARYGLVTMDQLFTPRQLLANIAAVELLRDVLMEAKQQLDHDHWRALSLYLTFAHAKALNFNGILSSWIPQQTKVRSVFDRHDFSFKWSFAEFDGARAILPWAISQVTEAYRGISSLVSAEHSLLHAGAKSDVTVLLGSATKLDLPSLSVDAIVTDPPYYDNVMYAECADYFYVWEKRVLRDSWPELTRDVLTDKDREAVANSSLFKDLATRRRGHAGGVSAADLADARYENLLTQSFQEAHRVLKTDGVLTVMFTHKRVNAWDTLGSALLEAGFEISSSWPVHTEFEHSLHQAKKNSASSTILLGCRKRASTKPAYWIDIRSDVERAAEDAAEQFAADGMRGVDLTLATYGPALAVLSRNWPVFTGNLDAEGDPEKIRPDVALDLARQRVAHLKKRQLLGGREVEFDRPTDWWLLAWSDFRAAQFPAGEALKLCIATDLELEDVIKAHRLVKAASGDVTLQTPAQRRTAGSLDPGAGVWPSLIDALHALMLTHDEEGLAASRAWMRATGRENDHRFAALVEASLHAVPRARDKEGEFVRPEARILESLRATLFDSIVAPTELTIPEVQASLFDDLGN